jgi:hypothetical protein
MDNQNNNTILDSVSKLTKDLKKAAINLKENEVRYLVDAYYNIQDYRIASAAQIRETQKINEPNEVLQWLFDNLETMENQIKKALNIYTENSELGRWCKSICGIGPVLTAGLMAHIDITKAPTAGHIWSFAGINPNQEWKKGEKRPFNAKLKVLCWKIGESFVKVQNNPNDVYGKIYAERKKLEIERNENNSFVEQAVTKLQKYKIGKNTDAYKAYSQGKLPPAHIHARAKRYAVKLFLAHYQEVAYELHYGVKPPKPYAIEILGHAHKVEVPNF